MKTLTMHGSSDDLIEAWGIEGEDEYNGGTHGKSPYVMSFTVMSPSEPLGLHIHVCYSGGWSFAVSPTEDKELDYCEFPAWPIRRTWGGKFCDYSETLEIDVPDDAKITEVN